MKVLIAHNRYRQFGGEDQVVAAEAGMLSRRGNLVEHLSFDNEAIQGAMSTASAALNSFFSLHSFSCALDVINRFQPDVLHVHNFLPTLSPSIFFAARRARIPVVQTLHNYRLVCANALLYREGSVCEECVTAGSFLPGIKHGCYRDSRLGSAVVGGSMALHAGLGTWTQRVDRFIALTDFAAQKLSGRVPRHLIRVKPNFVPDRGTGSDREEFLLYVGRLSEEKGLATLLAADRIGPLPMAIVIIGDGPMRAAVEEACARPFSRLRYIGSQPGEDVILWMKRAAALIVPSTCYEGFPMTIAEALSVGLPVLASRIGGLPEIIADGVRGLLHTRGDPRSLFSTVVSFSGMSKDAVSEMRRSARDHYLANYSEDQNYVELMRIYGEAADACFPDSSPLAPHSSLSTPELHAMDKDSVCNIA